MAWQKILACGFLASAVIVGCTVTTDDPSDDEDGGDGGRTSSGGSKASGGTAGSGGSSSGGTSSGGASSGGTGSGGETDFPDRNFVCAPDKETDPCAKCVQTKCCDEYIACGNDDFCSYRSEEDPGEAVCIQYCLAAQVAEAGTTDVLACAAECQGNRSTVSAATNDFINCLAEVSDDAGTEQNCSVQCFNGEI